MKVGDTVARLGSEVTHIVGRVSKWGLAYMLCTGEHLSKDEWHRVRAVASCKRCNHMRSEVKP